MRLSRLIPVVAGAILLTACAGVPGVYTVERQGDAVPGATGTAGPFDPVAYADGVWTTDVPKAVAAAVPAETLFAALAQDREAAQTKYGHSQGSGSPWSFVVSGTATVAEVDSSGPSALLVLDQTWAPASAVAIQVGPAMLGTAVRDSLGTVDFSTFTNQIDFADVATELNNRVKKDVVGSFDPASAVGKKVTFVGAFSLADPTTIVITPLELKVAS